MSCQQHRKMLQHGKMLRSSNEAEKAKAKDVKRLMAMYPSMKVLYYIQAFQELCVA